MAVRDLAIMLKVLRPDWPHFMLARELARIGHVPRNGAAYSTSYIKALIHTDPARVIAGASTRKQRLLAARRIARHTKAEWEDLAAVFSHTCVACGQSHPMTKDHIVPLYMGGSDAIENLQPLCSPCNSARGGEMTDYRGLAATAWTPSRIRQLRKALDESVDVFGARFGRSGRSVEDWEQEREPGVGRRRPDPMVLLAMQGIARRRKLSLE